MLSGVELTGKIASWGELELSGIVNVRNHLRKGSALRGSDSDRASLEEKAEEEHHQRLFVSPEKELGLKKLPMLPRSNSKQSL